eukprot:5144143-Amphidinium_carterae.1
MGLIASSPAAGAIFTQTQFHSTLNQLQTVTEIKVAALQAKRCVPSQCRKEKWNAATAVA